MNFVAETKSIAKVLNFGQHIIPDYQRPYAWDESNVEDFWNDVLKDRSSAHFLGSIVVVEGEPLEVIDGQQRLTTALIVLSVLRDKMRELNLVDLERGILNYIEYVNLEGKSQYRITNEDEKARTRLIDDVFNGEPLTENCKNREISPELAARKKVVGLLDRRLSESDDPSRVLVEVRDAVLEAEVVYTSGDDRKSAFTIFETLNDRGQDLTVVDLVKTVLFSNIGNSAHKKPQRNWEAFVNEVEASQIDWLSLVDFFAYYWNSKDLDPESSGDEVERRKLRRSVQDYIERQDDNQVASIEIIEDVLFTAKIFNSLGDTHASQGKPDTWKQLVESSTWDGSNWEEISGHLYGILVTQANQPFVLLFALLRNYLSDSGVITAKQLKKFLSAIKTFQFRWTIAKKSSTSTQRRIYRRAAVATEQAKTPEDIHRAMTDFINSANKYSPTDNQFADGLKKLTYSSTQKKDVFKVRYVLRELERSQPTTKLQLNDALTIEHLSSQKGKSEATPRNSWIFKLGNLTLLPQDINSSLPTKFDDKAAELADLVNDADSVLKQGLADKEWNSTRAGKRLEWIAEQACKIWPQQIEQ